MTVTQARKALAAAIEDEGVVPVAYRLGCSTTQVLWIRDGRRNPGLAIAIALEDAYKIPVRAWKPAQGRSVAAPNTPARRKTPRAANQP